MSALPILNRELRSRARKPWTAWARVLVGLLATLMAASTLMWLERIPGYDSLQGKMLFESLSATLFVFCLVEGVRQTADCLSQEKREGTLGLLFLTELNGLDVVRAKLAATSLGSFFALMAAFPVMAVALLAGGVTAGEFWRTVLVLLNTLFAGLAWGMWASARHRVEGRGLLFGLSCAFAFTLVPWLFELLLRPAGLPSISLSVALHLAEDAVYSVQPERFWMTLGLAHVLSWVLLAVAGRIVESGWSDDTSEPADPAASLPPWPGLGSKGNEPARIQEYWPARMQDDPAGWLARRRLRHRHMIWLSLVAMVAGPYLAMFILALQPTTPFIGLYTAVDLASAFLPVVLLLFITTRCFAEARRGGEMELVLSTPLSARELVLGQWRALWRQLRAPSILALAVVAFLVLARYLDSGPSFAFGGYSLAYYNVQCVNRVLCGLAACWLGLYLGLRADSITRAVGYGLLWLFIGPWLATWVFWVLIVWLLPSAFIGGGSTWLFTLAQVAPVAVDCFYLIGVTWWSRRQLIRRLRELAARN